MRKCNQQLRHAISPRLVFRPTARCSEVDADEDAFYDLVVGVAEGRVSKAAVQKTTGRAPVVYGGLSLLFPQIGTALKPTLAGCPLWVAQYTSAVQPSGIPLQVWKTCRLWQYTDSGSVDGVSGNVDRSRFQWSHTGIDNVVVSNGSIPSSHDSAHSALSGPTRLEPATSA